MLQSPCVCRRSSAVAEADENLRASSVTLPTFHRPAKPCPLSFVSADLRHYRRLTRLWNILRRVKHRGAHQGRFHSLRQFSEVKVMFKLANMNL